MLYYNERTYNTSKFDVFGVNYGTPVKLTALRRIFRTIKNNKRLAALVHEVNINAESAEDISSSAWALLPNLKVFHDEAGFLDKLRMLPKLESLAGPVFGDSNMTPTLVELKVTYFGKSDEDDSFTDLAKAMIKQNVNESLRRLSFVDYSGPDHHSDPTAHYKPRKVKPHWLLVFEELVKQEKMLNLTTLGLSGNLTGLGKKVTQTLQKCVNLQNLKTLILEHAEGVGNPLVELLTKHTPQLESLSIYPTNDNSSRQIDTICKTLENNIPHQLQELYIQYKSNDSPYDRQKLQESIVSSQRNLRRLKIEDGIEFFEGSHLEPVDFSSLYIKDWALEVQRQQMFSPIFNNLHVRPFYGKRHVQTIKRFLNEIHKHLEKDVVYANAAEQLPMLEQYYVAYTYVDMKARGVFLNGETIPFGCD